MNGRLHKFLPGRRNDIGDDILISLWLDYALFEEIETKVSTFPFHQTINFLLNVRTTSE
jgi:hypothetical protein